MYHLPEYCCSLRDSLHILMAAIFLDDRGPPPQQDGAPRHTSKLLKNVKKTMRR